MDPRAAEEAACLLWRARIAGERLAALPDHVRPQSLEDGYKIQDALAAGAGRAVRGWKLAVTSEAGQRRLGLSEPLAGRLFDGYVLDSGTRLAAGPMHMRVVEPEFAFRLGSDLPPRARPYEMEEVTAAVGDLHLAIEIPDSRFETFPTIGAAEMIADDAFAGWFLLGPKVPAWHGLDLPAGKVRLFRNDRLAGEGRALDTLGDPRRQLLWLARDRSKRGGGLKAGDIVTTGTCVAPVEIVAGDRVTAAFIDLGEVAVAFD
ncbi:MAG: 2-keto-4-pentenoate hydratase [Dongiaceae bacterium]